MNMDWSGQLRRCWAHGDMDRVHALLDSALARRGPNRVVIHAMAWAALVERDYLKCERLVSAQLRRDSGALVADAGSIPIGAWIRIDALLKGALGLGAMAVDLIERCPIGIPANVWIDDVISLVVSSTPSQEMARKLSTIEAVLSVDSSAATPSIDELRKRLTHVLGDVWMYLGMPDQAVDAWERGMGGNRQGVQSLAACELSALNAAKDGAWSDALAWCERGLAMRKDAALKDLHRRLRMAGESDEVHQDREGSAWTPRLDIRQPSFGQPMNLFQRLTADPYCILVHSCNCRS